MEMVELRPRVRMRAARRGRPAILAAVVLVS